MASGKNHDRAIYFTSPIIAAAASYHVGLELGLIAGASHLLGGLMLSPDLDLISRPYKRWGLLRLIWIPYQRLIRAIRLTETHAAQALWRIVS